MSQSRGSIVHRCAQFFLLPSSLRASGVHAGEAFIGRVVSIADGDTLTVLDQDRHQHSIRLAEIDAPEKA